ncbi:hypothetical protein Acr_00g0005790 [Actinidia rufa]|uniref:Uncharacterized protein n=1 Tax=Actinidia rufa TaxID=165716 RepID=A0A7J0D7U5_9ERIC|nr:hypothetical protein Acr_00g0005790 [Actinidia rufa]
MFSKTNLGGEESEQSLPSWISDHLGAKSYIDEASQSPSFPPISSTSPKMDTSSLTKEVNVCPRLNWTSSGLPIHFPQVYDSGFLGMARQFYPLAKARWRFTKPLFSGRLKVLVLPQPLTRFGVVLLLQGEAGEELVPRIPEQREGVEDEVLFASGDEWEFPSGVVASDTTTRVPRSWERQVSFYFVVFRFLVSLWSPDMRFSGKSCNKLPTLSEVDAKRTEAILGKIEPGGYFEVSKVLGSRTFNKHFAVGCTALSISGGDNTTSGDEGEFVTHEDSVEYLGVIRRDIGGAIRRALPGSVSTSDSELPPELRSDAMSARGKAKAEKATKTTAKPPTKGVVIREKRTREDDPLIEISEPDASKGKGAVSSPPPKRFKFNRGAINARGHAAEAGTSIPGGDMGSESMSDASVARRLLTGVIPASDKKEVDQLSENELVAKSFHALGQVVVFASSLAIRSQEHLHDMDFHMARADSAELELVKAQNRAVKAENRLAELNEEGSEAGTEVDDLKATVAELTNKLAKAKELAIEDFKASGEFKAAVIDSAATYFSEGFEFCKRQLLHQYPNLGVDVANMAMDPSFAEEEEARKEGEDPAAGVAPDV